MIFQTGHTEEYIRTNFLETYMDNLGILRWQSNNQIPFDDMLADFKIINDPSLKNPLNSHVFFDKEKLTNVFEQKIIQIQSLIMPR